MKPFLFSHADRASAGARALTDAELEIVSGGMNSDTQVMTADPAGGQVVVRDGIKNDPGSVAPEVN